jgi:hypothetical protein
MRTGAIFRGFLVTTGFVFLGLLAAVPWTHFAALQPTAGGVEAQDRPRVNAIQLQDEVNRLKELVPSQAHAMADVGYNWTNLWFATEHENWPLAQFYFDQAREHILWTIRIRPVRLNPDRTAVDMESIFAGIDSTSLRAVGEAIAQQDGARVTETYRAMLESCYACHQAVAKPYLRPMVPLAPASTIINFDPAATWPP